MGTLSTRDVQAGTLMSTLLLPVRGEAGNNRPSFDVTCAGPQGGRFTRSDVPYELLSLPAE